MDRSGSAGLVVEFNGARIGVLPGFAMISIIAENRLELPSRRPGLGAAAPGRRIISFPEVCFKGEPISHMHAVLCRTVGLPLGRDIAPRCGGKWVADGGAVAHTEAL